MTSDLVAFLRVRLDEDEAVVMRMFDFDRENSDSQMHISDGDELVITGGRMLREIEARRRIIATATLMDADMLESWHSVIADLATVYSDHPDYLQEWTP
jgi:hypothetical protein